jgi:hypothetical protein
MSEKEILIIKIVDDPEPKLCLAQIRELFQEAKKECEHLQTFDAEKKSHWEKVEGVTPDGEVYKISMWRYLAFGH